MKLSYNWLKTYTDRACPRHSWIGSVDWKPEKSNGLKVSGDWGMVIGRVVTCEPSAVIIWVKRPLISAAENCWTLCGAPVWQPVRSGYCHREPKSIRQRFFTIKEQKSGNRGVDCSEKETGLAAIGGIMVCLIMPVGKGQRLLPNWSRLGSWNWYRRTVDSAPIWAWPAILLLPEVTKTGVSWNLPWMILRLAIRRCPFVSS